MSILPEDKPELREFIQEIVKPLLIRVDDLERKVSGFEAKIQSQAMQATGTDAKERFRQAVAKFVAEVCVIDSQRKTDSRKLFLAWADWCKANDVPPRESPAFGKLLKSMFIQVELASFMKAGVRSASYLGIGLKDVDPAEEETSEELMGYVKSVNSSARAYEVKPGFVQIFQVQFGGGLTSSSTIALSAIHDSERLAWKEVADKFRAEGKAVRS